MTQHRWHLQAKSPVSRIVIGVLSVLYDLDQFNVRLLGSLGDYGSVHRSGGTSVLRGARDVTQVHSHGVFCVQRILVPGPLDAIPGVSVKHFSGVVWPVAGTGEQISWNPRIYIF